MKQRVVGIIVVVLALVVYWNSRSESTPPDPNLLRLNLSNGLRFEVKTVQKYTGMLAILPITTTTTTTLYYSTQFTDSDGLFHLLAHYRSALITQNIGDQEYKLNMFNHNQSLDQLPDTATDQATALLDIQIRSRVPMNIIYTPNGELQPIPEMGDLVDVLLRRYPVETTSDAEYEDFRQAVIEQFQDQLMQSGQHPFYYPDYPVEVGATWTMTHTGYLETIPLQIVTNYTLTERNNEIAIIDFEGNGISNYSGIIESVDLSEGIITQTGQLKVDLETGWPRSLELVQDIQTTEYRSSDGQPITRQGRLEISNKTIFLN